MKSAINTEDKKVYNISPPIGGMLVPKGGAKVGVKKTCAGCANLLCTYAQKKATR